MSVWLQNIIEGQNPRIKNPLQVGDKTAVHVRIVEGGKERVQIFEGVVMSIGGKSQGRSFTVRKISDGIGVERTFPFSSPILSKVNVLSRSKVRRAKLYYIRKLKGKASRLEGAFLEGQNAPVTAPRMSSSEDSPAKSPESPKE